MAPLLKVASDSNPPDVAGAIVGVVKEEGEAELQSIGAPAVNQAIKAVAIARDYVEASEYNLVAVPAFRDVEINGEKRTAIRIAVRTRPDPTP